MQLLEVLVGGFLVDTLVLFATIVAAGSLLAKKSLGETLARSASVVMGWLGCLLGLGAIAEALAAFDALAGELFGRTLEGTTSAELSPVFAVEGYESAQIVTVLLAVACNVAWARLTRARYLFINPLHLLLATALFLWSFAAVGAPSWVAIIVVGITVGSAAAWLPYLAGQRLDLAGDGFVLGTFHTLLLGAGRWVARKWGGEVAGAEPSARELGGSTLRRSPTLFAAVAIGGLGALFAINAGAERTATILQGVTLLHVFPSAGSTYYIAGAVLLGFEFAVGLWLLLACLPQVSTPLVESFAGFRRLLPDAQPALDAIFVLPEAPHGAVLGFLLSLAGGTLGYYIFGSIGLVPVIPGIMAAATGGAAMGVLAARAGGRRGLYIAAPAHGLVMSLVTCGLMSINGVIGEPGVAVELSDAGLVGMLLSLLLMPFS